VSKGEQPLQLRSDAMTQTVIAGYAGCLPTRAR
jgi:hypothetical protein